MKKYKIDKETLKILDECVEMLERESIMADYKNKKFIKMNTQLVLWQSMKLRNIINSIKNSIKKEKQ